jgi:hypothetical protein
MLVRLASCLYHPFVSVTAVAGFVVLTTAWLDARAQEAERRDGPLPLWWPLGPDPGAATASRHKLPFQGPTAPDFTLPEMRTGRPVSLSEFRGRPTVLIFGSFSCTYFCNHTADLRRLHREYGDRVNFLFVHISDAGHDNPELVEFMRRIRLPDSARAGIDKYQFDFPCLDARSARRVESMYSAYPQRLVILDGAGDVDWDSYPGANPGGLRLDLAEAALRRCLAGAG